MSVKPSLWLPVGLSFLGLLTMSIVSLAQTQLEFVTGERQVTLIELYSSEGCSSCPPADRWLAKLRDNKALWKSFVPVEFHVDYWNQLGWVDPFSNKAFTKRQQSYARQWLVSRVYTPAFVRNGKEWRPGLAQGLDSKEKVGRLHVRHVRDTTFTVEFHPHKKKNASLQVYAALLGHGLEQKVPAGENAGETLKHEFVVLALDQGDLKMRQDDLYAGRVTISTKNYKNPKSYGLAFWVSEEGRLSPLQATGGDLQPRQVKLLKLK